MKRIFTTFLLILICLCGCSPSNETTAPHTESTLPPTTSTTAAQSTSPPTTVAQSTSPPQTTVAQATNPPPTTSAPQTTAPPQTEPQIDTVSLFVTCKIALDSGKISSDIAEFLPENGIILSTENAELQSGDTVFDLLARECRANRVHLEFVKTAGLGAAYVEGIGNLYELDAGPLSGWVFTVNGVWPGQSSSSVELSPGDSVEWIYTTDLGRDVGAPDAALGG